MATVKDLLRAETLRLGSVAPVAGGNAVGWLRFVKAIGGLTALLSQLFSRKEVVYACA